MWPHFIASFITSCESKFSVLATIRRLLYGPNATNILTNNLKKKLNEILVRVVIKKVNEILFMVVTPEPSRSARSHENKHVLRIGDI